MLLHQPEPMGKGKKDEKKPVRCLLLIYGWFPEGFDPA
jgi:hypothetical protein